MYNTVKVSDVQDSDSQFLKVIFSGNTVFSFPCVSMATPALLWFVDCVMYLFPSFYLKAIHILESKVSLL